MKGLFIPDITAEMFRNGCLEGIEELMAEGVLYDIEYEPTKMNDNKWIRIDDELPSVDEDGYSDYILLSFENCSGLCIGQYRIDVEGNGVFFDGDDYETLTTLGIFVNAWMPLPKPYRSDAND